MLRNDLSLDFGQEFTTYAGNLGTNQYDIGQKMRLPDGRTFRFGSVGATTLVAGTLVQAGVPVANHVAQTIATATAVGATGILFTDGGTPTDFGLYDSGVFVDQSGGTGLGFYYPIARSSIAPSINPNVATSTARTVTLQTGYTVQVAINTSDVCSLVASPWKNVVIGATANTSMPCGVALTAATTAGTINTTGGNAYNVAMGKFCWFQTGGLCAIRRDATTLVVGQPVGPSTTTAGDVSVIVAATLISGGIVGWCQTISASAGFGTIWLTLDI